MLECYQLRLRFSLNLRPGNSQENRRVFFNSRVSEAVYDDSEFNRNELLEQLKRTHFVFCTYGVA